MLVKLARLRPKAGVVRLIEVSGVSDTKPKKVRPGRFGAVKLATSPEDSVTVTVSGPSTFTPASKAKAVVPAGSAIFVMAPNQLSCSTKSAFVKAKPGAE